MKKYELAVAINGKIEENDKNAVLDKVKALIERFNGSITAVDDWGRKRYAYEIEKVREGWYVFIKFQAEPEAPAEIEQRMRIMDGIHRYLIVSDEKELTVKHESEQAKPVEAAPAESAPEKDAAAEAAETTEASEPVSEES